jgi:hypothetical protein
VFICGSISLLSGCDPKKPPAPKGYFGPTQSMSEVVHAVNQNNAKLPTLWADIRDIRVQFTDDRGRRQDEKLDGGVLLYRQQPRSLRLDGRKSIVGSVMDLGSNENVYWLAIKEGPDTAWWGRHENVGAECSRPIPIQPSMLMEVLGVTAFNPNFDEAPAPVMRFNNDADAYTFIWIAPAGDRFVALREVWYDRRTKLPKLVVLYDAHGRVTLRAYLSNHKPVEIEKTPREQWPQVAGEYDLFFPETGAKLNLRLGQVKLSNKGAPSQATFNFTPDARRLGVSNLIQLDEACGP